MRQVGATIGVAVLGTILLSAYRSQLDLGGLPATAAADVRTSVAAGVGVAAELHSAALLVSVRAAFAHGLDVMLAVCAGIAALSAVLALVFLPRRAHAGAGPEGGPGPAAVTGSGVPPAPAQPDGRIRGMSTHGTEPHDAGPPDAGPPDAGQPGAGGKQEGQDACFHPGAGVAAVPRAGAARRWPARAAGTQEGQDACFHPGAGVAAVPRAGVHGDPG